MKIPWVKPYIGEEEFKKIRECFEDNWFTMGPKVKKFEEILCEKVGSGFSLAVNSGTAALDVALKILDIQPGDEIIVPAFTYIATANAVLYQHATPVFADIDENTYNISPQSVKKRITKKTKAIIAIDYAGQSADYDELYKIIKDKEIFLVEDGAPGFSGSYKEKSLCNMGHISTTSFHMAKLFTTIEGGMIFTDNDEWYEKGKIIRSQGESPNEKYYHPFIGHNYRMTDLHAAIGLAQINRVDEVKTHRQKLAGRYISSLKGIEKLVLPTVSPYNKHAWFLFPILIKNRAMVVNYLKSQGIETNISYPYPIYKQPIYKEYYTDSCPIAERICGEVLCLPMYFDMTEEEQNYVIEHLYKIME